MKNILLFLLLCILLFTINNNLRETFNIDSLGKDMGNLSNSISEIAGFENRELENCDDVENISKRLYNNIWNSKFVNNEDIRNKYQSKWKDYLYNKVNLYKKLCYCDK